jgi:hypothetical protein
MLWRAGIRSPMTDVLVTLLERLGEPLVARISISWRGPQMAEPFWRGLSVSGWEKPVSLAVAENDVQ